MNSGAQSDMANGVPLLQLWSHADALKVPIFVGGPYDLGDLLPVSLASMIQHKAISSAGSLSVITCYQFHQVHLGGFYAQLIILVGRPLSVPGIPSQC